MIFLASPALAESGYRTAPSQSSCAYNDEDREQCAGDNANDDAAQHVRGLVNRPVFGHITSPFGRRGEGFHYGIDIAASIGTPISAVSDGVVVESGPATGFGMWVVLRHSDGFTSVYGHLNRRFVEAGERVSAGAKIAEVGNRGNSTGPHLHLEIWNEDGKKIDPARWLRRHGVNI
jgi:murein DD-endopeptidase MepM/ murein hydrolase activator NlpD